MPSPAHGIVLPPGHTASTLFHAVLAQAAQRFPDELRAAVLPDDPKVFKRDYGRALARFEAARAASERRSEIARFVTETTQSALQFAQGEQRVSFAEHLSEAVALPRLRSRVLSDTPRLRIEVPFEGTVYRGREVSTLASQLAEQHDMTQAACAALQWMVDYASGTGGVVDLRGQRFVLFGAAAELAPTRMLLSAGARVLFIDLRDPLSFLPGASLLSGTLVHPEGGSNLLESPREVLAAIRHFMDGSPVHVGMFAYAAGASQEWRLGAAMAGVVSQLDPSLVASVSLLVSPTTANVLDPECVAEARGRFAQRTLWQAALLRAGVLSAPGHHESHGVCVGLSTVSIQGLSYQAAQYVSKLCTAESFARYGVAPSGGAARPVTVSANVAGITRTRSLSHPLFQAAFLGAVRFGVRVFDPETTQALSGLLMLHDLLNPAAPCAASVQPADPRDKARGLFSQKVHGGIYVLPFELEAAIRVAGLIGVSSRPSLLFARTPSTRPGLSQTNQPT